MFQVMSRAVLFPLQILIYFFLGFWIIFQFPRELSTSSLFWVQLDILTIFQCLSDEDWDKEGFGSSWSILKVWKSGMVLVEQFRASGCAPALPRFCSVTLDELGSYFSLHFCYERKLVQKAFSRVPECFQIVLEISYNRNCGQEAHPISRPTLFPGLSQSISAAYFRKKDVLCGLIFSFFRCKWRKDFLELIPAHPTPVQVATWFPAWQAGGRAERLCRRTAGMCFMSLPPPSPHEERVLP